MKRALIVVDVQNDFLPGGTMAVSEGDAIIPFVLDLIRSGDNYDLLVVTQDWHPEGHGSFASSHAGADPFQLGELAGLPQMLWPDHCIKESDGARLAQAIEELLAQAEAAGRPVLFVKKGQSLDVDSYSAFFDNARLGDTGLEESLKEQDIGEVDVVGLAFDYCVKFTALDAASLGFRTRVLMQGTRSVDPSAEAQIRAELSTSGVGCVKVDH